MSSSQHKGPAERQKARLAEEARQRRKRRDEQREEQRREQEQERLNVLLDPVQRQPYPPEPNRHERASSQDLGGLSEYQVVSAGSAMEGDPISSLREWALPHPVEEDDLTPPQMTVSSGRPRPPGEPRSVLPDELGASYLRGAVQEPRATESLERAPVDERLRATRGEQRLLEDVARSFASNAGLVTEMPYRSGIEAALSELSREAVHHARQAGARTHAEIRQRARAYLDDNAERVAAFLAKQIDDADSDAGTGEAGGQG